ncbi:MAG: PEP/pyruvate-binding domain-containing protein [Acidimicrobiia bacterium]
MSNYIIWFDEFEEEHRPRVGGKVASLGTMLGAGLPVPPGFAVTTDAFETLRSHTETRDTINGLLESIDLADPAGLRQISREVRKLIEDLPLEQGIEEEVRQAYQALCDRCGVENLPVAVRSSATAEDLPNASFAGQQDTYLWIKGEEAVLDHLRKCWSSLFTDRAIAYRHEMGFGDEIVSMSVAIQKMVDPKAAGVAFTLNPTNGDRSQVAIDASYGFGEAVVGGEVTPDNYLVDKVMREIVRRSIGPKAIEFRINESNEVEKVEVDPERQALQCLDDDEIKALADMARRAEKFYGGPQDLEWAIDRHLPAGENILLLQARPETVWSRKERKPIPQAGDQMASIIATLISPFNAQKKSSE